VAHKYPPWPISNLQVVSTEDFNENVQEFADEVGGATNEQNLKQNFLTDIARVDGGAVMRLAKSEVGFASDPAGFSSPGGRFGIPRTNSWEIIATTTTDIISPGCILMVHASWQHAIDGPGTLYALSVESQAIPETILGGVEGDNELTTRGGLAVTTGTSDSTYAPTRRRMPMASQLLLPLPEGKYSVSLLGRILDGSWHTSAAIGVDSRELICIQLFR